MNRPENVDFVLKDIKSNILDSYVNSLEDRIDKAIEELELWKPKNKVIKTEIDYLLEILKGGDKE